MNTFFWIKETRNGGVKKQENLFAIVRLLCVYSNIQVYWLIRFILLLNNKKECLVQYPFIKVTYVNIFEGIRASAEFLIQKFL